MKTILIVLVAVPVLVVYAAMVAVCVMWDVVWEGE